VKVRIRETPSEAEVDGVNLTKYTPGTVREVSSSIGSWLIAEGYAEPEMRTSRGQADEFGSSVRSQQTQAADRRRHSR
jgi:5,10-methenyltetrahydromethanopterin hydrogenase